MMTPIRRSEKPVGITRQSRVNWPDCDPCHEIANMQANAIGRSESADEGEHERHRDHGFYGVS